MIQGPSSERKKLPRSRVTRNVLPSRAWAAVAPRHTITSGRTRAISASSHGRQALISTWFGFFVEASLTADTTGSPLEVLDRVRDVDRPAIDPRLHQRGIEQLPGGADEWLAGDVFLVARLLADQQHAGPFTAGTEDRLRAAEIQVARGAAGGGGAQALQSRARRDALCGRLMHMFVAHCSGWYGPA